VALELPAASPFARATSERRPIEWILGGLIALAILLRLMPILISPSVVWGDEIFQSTEQAHRLVYGTGLVPWEFELGIRSWLLPGAIAALMETARLVGDGPDYYLPLIAAVFAAIAALPVYCVFRWCERWFGLPGAILGGFVVAIDPELVYFGARTLAEILSGHLLIAAIYLLETGASSVPRRRLVAAGALLGLIFALRLQLAPALGLVTLWGIWHAPRARFWPLAAGGAISLGIAGLLDALTLGYPFASLWRYLDVNLFDNVSSLFGTLPWNYYLSYELAVWQGGVLPLAVLVIIGAVRRPLLLATAVLIVACHSAIPHKEVRFIYPAIVLLAALAAIGFAQVAAWARARYPGRGTGVAWSISCACYACFVAYLAWSGETMGALRGLMHEDLLAAHYVEHMQGICGIGLFGRDGHDWVNSGGYTYFQQPVPIYWPKNASEFADTDPGFNVLVSSAPPPEGMVQKFPYEKCFGSVCIGRRTGSCAAVPMMPMPVPDPLRDPEAERTR
jgi:GPI mannosyltransferase 3